MIFKYFWVYVFILFIFSINAKNINFKNEIFFFEDNMMDKDTAVFGAGCFWCVEAIFSNLKGVHSVTSGYAGGEIENPTYKEVCTGTTGHAEVTRIIYDPTEISFNQLLEVFWQTHDPTTLNKQGNDVGTQYRSCIFYLTEKQRETALYFKKELNKSGAWHLPIVTEILPLEKFYPAENYHQDYYEINKGNSYCNYVIQPKLEKLKKVFNEKLKEED